MLQNREETIEKIAKHLGVAYTPELIKAIAEANTFQNLKEAKRAKEEETAKFLGKTFNMFGPSIYRKGKQFTNEKKNIVKSL